MRRIHALELEDQAWMLRVVREAGMATLRFAYERLDAAERICPIIQRALESKGVREILDLCSGGGGPVLAVARKLSQAGITHGVTPA